MIPASWALAAFKTLAAKSLLASTLALQAAAAHQAFVATVHTDLVSAGLSQAQAAGVMANMEHESSFDVENHAWDTNGFRGYGLLSWNGAGYGAAHTLVTGHPQADLKRQIGFLLHDTDRVKFGLRGATAWQVGGNWSYWVEGCVNCQPGLKQWRERASLATKIYKQFTIPCGVGMGREMERHV